MIYTMKGIQDRFDKYGKYNCKKAYYYNRIIGEGAKTIGEDLGFATGQVDVMINVWEAYLEIENNG